jgi:hypothetical protein
MATTDDSVQFIGRADVDVRSLNQYEASTYRRELLEAVYRNPGAEFDLVGEMGEADREFYLAKVKEVNDHLATFPER